MKLLLMVLALLGFSVVAAAAPASSDVGDDSSLDDLSLAAMAADPPAIKHPNVIYKPFKDASGNAFVTAISPFHVKITDYCDVGRQRQVKATYTSGDLHFQNLSLWPRIAYPLSLGYSFKDTGVSNLTLGEFDYKSSRLRFAYKDCVWYDDETWKKCGECRAAHWSGTAPPCSKDKGTVLTREMDCSLILGVYKAASLPNKDSPNNDINHTNNILPHDPPANNTFTNGTSTNKTILDSQIPHFNLTLANTIPIALAPRNAPSVSTSLPSILLSATDASTSYRPPVPRFEPGTCRYVMTLFQICSPTESTAYTTTFGYIFSILDNNRVPIMLYPEGVGRIDAGAKRLGGLEDFRLAWDNNLGVVYFSNGLKWWKSDNNYGEDNKENKDPGGGCEWKPWDKDDLGCNGQSGMYWRSSGMDCEFEC